MPHDHASCQKRRNIQSNGSVSKDTHRGNHTPNAQLIRSVGVGSPVQRSKRKRKTVKSKNCERNRRRKRRNGCTHSSSTPKCGRNRHRAQTKTALEKSQSEERRESETGPKYCGHYDKVCRGKRKHNNDNTRKEHAKDVTADLSTPHAPTPHT
jgi:hypothetical protein